MTTTSETPKTRGWGTSAYKPRDRRKVVTSNICPPIPDRNSDWCAYLDGNEEDGPYGYGRTELAALADLLDRYFDDVPFDATDVLFTTLHKEREAIQGKGGLLDSFNRGYLRAIRDLESLIG